MMTAAGTDYYMFGGSDTVRVSAPVTRGQGLERDPVEPEKCRPWSANSITRAGVAMGEAKPPASNGPTQFAPVRQDVGVARAPRVVGMVFAAAAQDGDVLVAASLGRVTKATAGPPADQIVGTCRGRAVDPGTLGATTPASVAANQVGLVELA